MDTERRNLAELVTIAGGRIFLRIVGSVNRIHLASFSTVRANEDQVGLLFQHAYWQARVARVKPENPQAITNIAFAMQF